jgi:hypothetical protein
VYYTVFARYDASYSCDGDVWSDSGRAVYVTDLRSDADAVWARWNDDSDWTDTDWWSVRRGCVEQHATLADAWNSDAVRWADDVDCAADAQPPANWRR